MAILNLTPRKALILFIAIAVILFAEAVWWVAFMATLIDEKVQMAIELGADQSYVDRVQEQEISRQIMVGSEGVFFLLLVGGGSWLIYRALVKTEELKFHQQNFLMAVTHELKTPLASMKIYLDSLSSQRIPEEKKAAIIPRLREDAERLERLVENVLDAGRFERSGYHLEKESFSLSDMVESRMESLRKYPSRVPVEINKRSFQDDIHFYGDPHALSRAIDAVLENSIKYNDSDRIIVNLELFRENEFVYLNIADNGIGLTKEDAARVFDRFYRVGGEINRSRPGSGLGLYLCREIIRAHGGEITVSSRGPGTGVTFNIKLKTVGNNENDTTG